MRRAQFKRTLNLVHSGTKVARRARRNFSSRSTALILAALRSALNPMGAQNQIRRVPIQTRLHARGRRRSCPACSFLADAGHRAAFTGMQTRRSAALSLHSRAILRVLLQKRAANRLLSTPQLLALLRAEAPQFFGLAEIVGKWVWIQFTEKQPREITAQLAQLGFHWNNKRQAWQHPCGQFCPHPFQGDPRERYATHYAADLQPA